MSTGTYLTVPVPQIVLDPPAGPPAIEKPVTVHVGDIQYPDSVSLGDDDVRVVGLFVFRGNPGSEEVWDSKAKTWKSLAISASALADLEPVALMPGADEDPEPWKGIFVAAGQKDASGGDTFTAASSGTPRYRVRAFAKGERDTVEYLGLSAQSSDLLFTSAAANQRFTVELDPKDAATATTVRLVLKNAAMAEAGFIEIRAAGGQEVDIVNCTSTGSELAKVSLTADGDIRLEPASGRRVILTRELYADEISYQPSGGGSRVTL